MREEVARLIDSEAWQRGAESQSRSSERLRRNRAVSLGKAGEILALVSPAQGDGEWVTDEAVVDALEKVKRSEKVSPVEAAMASAYELGWRDGHNSAAPPSPPAPGGWRPISEAPRDGTDFLALMSFQRKHHQMVGCFAPNGKFVSWPGRNNYEPVAWQPLPSPPLPQDETP